MEPWQGDPVANSGWQNDPIASPKLPDIGGIQKMAQSNLAANDNKEETPSGELKEPQTPAERLNTAIGHPVSNLLNPEDTTPIPGDMRRQYTKAAASGGAVDFGDFTHTMLHAIIPVISGAFQRTEAAGRIVGAAGEGVGKGYESGTLIDASDRSDVGQMLGAAANIPTQALSASYAAYQGAAQQLGKEISNPGLGRDIAIFPEAMIGAEGMQPPLSKNYIPQPLKEPVAKITGKSPAEVTPADVEQVTHEIKIKAPEAKDFKNVAAVTGLPEKMLDTVYDATGKTPENVLVDGQSDPSIPRDIANDTIPEAYEPFVEQRELPHEELQVERSDGDRVFNVTDKDGDYVTGGFTSAEEAQHYVDDKGFDAAEKEALEAREKERAAAPATEEKSAEPEKSLVVRIKEKLLGKDNQAALTGEPEVTPNLESSAEESGRPISSTRPIVSPGTHEPSFHTSEARPPEGVFTTRATKPSISEGGLTKSIESSYHNTNDVETIKSKAKQSENDFSKLLKYISDKVKGSEFYKTRIKDDEGIARKLQFKEPNKISDILGGRILVDSRESAEAVLEQLKKNSNVTHVDDFLNDEGRPSGYRAIHAQIEGDNGISAEVQIQPRDIGEAHNESHALYKEMQQSMDAGDVEKAEAMDDKAKEINNSAWQKFKDRVSEFSKSEKGELDVEAIKKSVGDTITSAEKFVGKLTGGIFKQLSDGYIKTFQPELAGDIAKRADAYLAKFKAAGQEAENGFYRQSAEAKRAFDKLTPDQRMEWLYDHETGRWTEEGNPDHARMQAMYDSLHEAEQEAGVGSTAYKENYLPHQWENPDAVNKFFRSDVMIKKYGKDWFNKASEFRLVQEGVRAGFKLKTDNPESMLVARQLASFNLRATMDLMRDLERDGIAKRATVFSIDKKIAKTQAAIDELQAKYKKEFEKKNNPQQGTLFEKLPPAESKLMKLVEGRLDELKTRLDNFNKEKSENKLPPAQLKELKDNGFKVIGPDNKVWNIHEQAAPVWKNAMEMKGLWERQGVLGDAYRTYTQGKALWVRTKLLASLFHPGHVAVIDISSDMASAAHHLIQGGKLSDLGKDILPNLGLTKETAKLQDHPQIQAWNTKPEDRTPQQHADVQRMVEGGFTPTISARDTVRFRENFEKGIKGVGKNNLRLIGTALETPGMLMAPMFEHWIPGMKTDSYFQRTELALKRDPSLAQDAGKRGEVFRQIAQDIDRNYGEMNSKTQFWNPIIRDAFNASFLSGGWKLAMLQNFRGLAEPAHVAYNFAKTGEFSKAAITHQMLQSYIYTANMLMLGAGLNYLFTGAVGTLKDWMTPQTGDKNPDGTPIRLSPPAFFKEPVMLLHDINSEGAVPGTGTFFYHQSLIPGIMDTLNNRDFVGRTTISDPTDLNQWKNAGWDFIKPINMSNQERAEQKGSKTAAMMGWAGFPIAGAYNNQTPFEQKVLYTYDQQNPPKGDVYQAKLKADLKTAVAQHDSKTIDETKALMKKEGMTEHQISNAEKPYTKPFVDQAWKELPVSDQKHLIESASDEEKKKFKVKSVQ